MASIKGVWRFNDIPYPQNWGMDELQDVNFSSNGKDFSFMQVIYDGTSEKDDRYYLKYENDLVFTDSVIDGVFWENESYKIVDFGATEQPVSDSFYEWLSSNASQQASSTCTITYNGKVIASLSGGESATLTCGGKKALTNIEIVSENGATATYNGEEISGGNAFTLACAGKKMLTDVVVTAKTLEVEGGGESEPEQDSIVGTWLFNDVLVPAGNAGDQSLTFTCYAPAAAGKTYTTIGYYANSDGVVQTLNYRDTTGGAATPFYTGSWRSNWSAEWKRIEILSESADEDAIAFLKANATKLASSGGSS